MNKIPFEINQFFKELKGLANEDEMVCSITKLLDEINNQFQVLEEILRTFYLSGNYQKGIDLSEKLVAFYTEKNNKSFLALSWHYRAIYNLCVLDFEKGYFAISEAIRLFYELNDKNRLALCHNVLGSLYLIPKRYEASYIAFIDCINLAKEVQDFSTLARGWINYSRLFLRLNQIEEAIKYIKEAEKYLPQVKEPHIHISTYTNYGTFLIEAQQYEKAIDKLCKGLDYIKKPTDFVNFRVTLLSKIAYVYFNNPESNNEKGIKYAYQAYKYCKEYKEFTEHKYLAYTQYFHALNIKKKHKEVIELYEKFPDNLERLGYYFLEELMEQVAIAHESENNIKKALEISKFVIKCYKKQEQESKDFKILSQKVINKITNHKLAIEYKDKIIKEQKQYFKQLEEEISKRKLVETELIKSNEELASFATVASHDMREPLRMVASYSQLLQRRVKDDEILLELTEFIVDASKRMQIILSDLIEFVRINVNVPEKQTINLNNLLEVKILDFRKQIAEYNIKIEKLHELPTILGVAKFFQILFKNLLSNAIKYRNKTEQAELIIDYKLENTHHKIYFIDNGIGIDKEFHESIFEPFRRLHTRKEYPGVGLGLAAVQRIVVEHLKGKITLESEIGKGSTFIIEFPE